MMKILFFLLFAIQGFCASKTICLNMIVKNECHVIRRCLESVKPLIDYWVIVDTGSTDGTQEVIQELLKDVPGELYERPWVDFAHNRNEAMQYAKGCGDYLLFMDADEQLKFSADFTLPDLDKDAFFITSVAEEVTYKRGQLVNNQINWKWKGVIHECLVSSQNNQIGELKGVVNIVREDGARSSDPNKLFGDIDILKQALVKEPENARYMFYLAQTYANVGLDYLALDTYKRRVEMGGWEEEVAWAKYKIAFLQDKIGAPVETIVAGYSSALDFEPTRQEVYYYYANFLRRHGNAGAGFLVAANGLSVPEKDTPMFVEKWIYNYGLLFEYSICAILNGNIEAAIEASLEILKFENLPTYLRKGVEENIAWIGDLALQNWEEN